MRRLAPALVALLALAAAGASAAPVTRHLSARRGGTTATLTYRFDPANPPLPYSHMRLAIARDGVRRYDSPVRALLCGIRCSLFSGVSALTVRDLEGNGSPDVVLTVYSGGAHCCFITQVLRFDPGLGTFVKAQRDFGDPGMRIEALGGGLVLRSADDRFAYEFAAFAFSGLPLQIWRFRAGRFVDVTRRFPALVEHDAAALYGDYLSNRRQRLGLGFLAAWAADEDLLGHAALVRSRLASLEAAGLLRSVSGWPSGRAFVTQLQRFLVKTGYA